MKNKLLISACTKLIAGLILIGLLLFPAAGTLHWPGAWLLLAILFIPMLIAGTILLIKSPELLQKRLNSKETESSQKLVVLLSLLMFVGGFIVAGLDYRFSWSAMPGWISAAAEPPPTIDWSACPSRYAWYMASVSYSAGCFSGFAKVLYSAA